MNIALANIYIYSVDAINYNATIMICGEHFFYGDQSNLHCVLLGDGRVPILLSIGIIRTAVSGMQVYNYSYYGKIKKKTIYMETIV